MLLWRARTFFWVIAVNHRSDQATRQFAGPVVHYIMLTHILVSHAAKEDTSHSVLSSSKDTHNLSSIALAGPKSSIYILDSLRSELDWMSELCIGGREVRRRIIKLSVMELFNNNERNILQTLNVTSNKNMYEDPDTH